MKNGKPFLFYLLDYICLLKKKVIVSLSFNLEI